MKPYGMKNLGRILSVLFEKTLVRKGDIATKTGVLQLVEGCSFFSLYWKYIRKYCVLNVITSTRQLSV